MQAEQAYTGGRRAANLVVQQTQSARTAPTSATLRQAKDASKVPAPAHVPIRVGPPSGQVRMVRQYVPATA